MCGVVGVYQSEPINVNRLNKARDALSHRGPDGYGTWLTPDRQVGLAHRRLSIVDAPLGAQPMLNQNKTLCASVNGELYDYDKLRRSLEEKGHLFRTRSDSELVLHLYAEYGLSFVDHLRGEFAFVLYDHLQRKMMAVRDRFGIKPLCYHYSNEGLFYVASEAKAILALGITPAWNEYALYHALCLQYTPTDQTLFQSIQPVLPGHMMIYDGKTLVIKPYWDLDYSDIKPSEPLALETLTGQLDTQLRDAIGTRLHVDENRLCCHLSGGVDSATIASLGSQLYGKPLPCFSVSFPHQAYDEMEVAKRMAQHIGAPFHPVFLSGEDMAHALSDAVYYSEGLAINHHLSAKYLLNQAIKKAGFKVALTGEGADELFAGYLHLQQDYLPHVATRHSVATGIHVSNDATFSLDAMREQWGFVPTFIKAKAAIGLKLQSLFQRTPFPAEQIISDMLRNNLQGERFRELPPLYQSTYLWIKYALSGYILRTLGDGCEMAHGIEGRTPFLDHHLFNFSKQIPLSMNITQTSDKYILRETVKNYVTPEILQRKKHPFIAPPISLLTQKKGYEHMRDSLQSCDRVPFFDKKKVNAYLDSIVTKTVHEQVAAEPVVMLILTATLLSQRYGL